MGVEDSKARGAAVVVESIQTAVDELRVALNDELKSRDIDLLWRAYSNVELAICLGKYVISMEDKVGRFNELYASSANDPAGMPLEVLKKRLIECVSDLEYAEYEFETTGGGPKGLAAARKCRDCLKSMLLAHRKNTQARAKKRSKTDSK